MERQQGEIHIILLLLWFCVISAAMFSTMHDAFSILVMLAMGFSTILSSLTFHRPSRGGPTQICHPRATVKLNMPRACCWRADMTST